MYSLFSNVPLKLMHVGTTQYAFRFLIIIKEFLSKNPTKIKQTDKEELK